MFISHKKISQRISFLLLLLNTTPQGHIFVSLVSSCPFCFLSPSCIQHRLTLVSGLILAYERYASLILLRVVCCLSIRVSYSLANFIPVPHSGFADMQIVDL
jgi:hypothetical protein